MAPPQVCPATISQSLARHVPVGNDGARAGRVSRRRRSAARPPDSSASSRPASYSDWESNSVCSRLSLEPPRGVLSDSLSSDGLQKSDANREREAETAISGAEVVSAGPIRPMGAGLSNRQNGAPGASAGGKERRTKIERTADRRFDHRRMVV